MPLAREIVLFVAMFAVALAIIARPVEKMHEPFIASAPIAPSVLQALDKAVCHMVVQKYVDAAAKLAAVNTVTAKPKCSAVLGAPGKAALVDVDAMKVATNTKVKLKTTMQAMIKAVETYIVDVHCKKSGQDNYIDNTGALLVGLKTLLASFQ